AVGLAAGASLAHLVQCAGRERIAQRGMAGHGDDAVADYDAIGGFFVDQITCQFHNSASLPSCPLRAASCQGTRAVPTIKQARAGRTSPTAALGSIGRRLDRLGGFVASGINHLEY